MNRKTAALLSLLVLPLAGCLDGETPSAKKPDTAAASRAAAGESAPVDFVTQIKPILRERCVMCHNKQTMPERHSFETRALVMKGDAKGPILVPGKPEESRLLFAVTAPKVHEQAMPPVSLRVPPGEIAVLTRWIREGAPWPAGKSGRIVPLNIPLE